jgi:hypothetical protein
LAGAEKRWSPSQDCNKSSFSVLQNSWNDLYKHYQDIAISSVLLMQIQHYQ